MAGNIPIYDAPNAEVFRPNESGAAVVAQNARRIGSMARETGTLYQRAAAAVQRGLNTLGHGFKDVGELVESHQANNEISDGTRTLAMLHNDLDNKWAQTRDGTDPSIAAGPKFLSDVAFPALDKIADSAVTKQGRTHMRNMVDAARLHYAQSTHADDMTAAGDNAVRNAQTVIDTATRRSQADITTVDYNGEMIKQTFEGIRKSNVFDAKTLIKLNTERDKALKENTMAGIKGAMDRNPFQAVKDLDGWAQKYNLSGPEVETLTHYAKAQQRAHIADANNAAIAQGIASRKASEGHLQTMMNGWKDDKGNFDPTKLPQAKDVLVDPKLTHEDRGWLFNFLNGIGNKENPPAKFSDPMTYGGLKSRVGDATNPLTPQEVNEAFTNKKLDPSDAKELMSDIIKGPKTGEDKQWDETHKALDKTLTKAMNLDQIIKDPVDALAFDAASRYIEKVLIPNSRLKGITPDAMRDPANKNYFLSDPGLQNILHDKAKYQQLWDLQNKPRQQEEPPPQSLKLPPRKTNEEIWGKKR